MTGMPQPLALQGSSSCGGRAEGIPRPAWDDSRGRAVGQRHTEREGWLVLLRESGKLTWRRWYEGRALTYGRASVGKTGGRKAIVDKRPNVGVGGEEGQPRFWKSKWSCLTMGHGGELWSEVRSDRKAWARRALHSRCRVSHHPPE